MQQLLETGIIQDASNGGGASAHPNQGTSLCFYCNRRLATGNDRLPFHLSMLVYVFMQMIYVVLEDTVLFLKTIKFRKPRSTKKESRKETRKVKNHMHVAGQLCARCVSAGQRTSVPFFDTVSEYIYMCGQALSLAAMLLGGLVFGIVSICTSVFPGRSERDSHEQAEYEARRLAEDLRRRQEEDDAYWAMRDAERIRNLNPSSPVNEDLLEDDQLVREAIGSAKAVLNGTEAVDDFLKTADELDKYRQKTLKRDRQRSDAYAKYIRKCKDADDLRARGDLARRRGYDQEANDFYERENIAREESSVLYLDYKLI